MISIINDEPAQAPTEGPQRPPSITCTDYEDDDVNDGEDSETSYGNLRRSEAMDAIEEEWEEDKDTFRLDRVHLDRFAIGFLMRKWELLKYQRATGGAPRSHTKVLHKLVFDRCSLGGTYEVHLMAIFLSKIGPELKHVSIFDRSSTCTGPEASKGKPPISVFGCLGHVYSLERLAIERTDLRGKVNGLQLRYMLANNRSLKALKLYGCQIDDEFLEHLVIGLQGHPRIQRLDLGNWKLTDDQLKRLVDALIDSAMCYQLKVLDISKSKIGEPSLSTLAHLLNHCCALEEIILCSCNRLFTNVKSDSPNYLSFVSAIQSRTCLKRLALSHCKLVHLRDLDAESFLEIAQGRATYSSRRAFSQAIVPSHPYNKKEPKTSLFPSWASELSMLDYVVARVLSFMQCI